MLILELYLRITMYHFGTVSDIHELFFWFSSPIDTLLEHSGLCCCPNPCAGGTFPAFSLWIQPDYFSISPRDWEKRIASYLKSPGGWNSYCFPSLSLHSPSINHSRTCHHTPTHNSQPPLDQITACKESHWLLLAWSVRVCHNRSRQQGLSKVD